MYVNSKFNDSNSGLSYYFLFVLLPPLPPSLALSPRPSAHIEPQTLKHKQKSTPHITLSEFCICYSALHWQSQFQIINSQTSQVKIWTRSLLNTIFRTLFLATPCYSIWDNNAPLTQRSPGFSVD